MAKYRNVGVASGFFNGLAAYIESTVRPRSRTGRHQLRWHTRSCISMPSYSGRMGQDGNQTEDRRATNALAGMAEQALVLAPFLLRRVI